MLGKLIGHKKSLASGHFRGKQKGTESEAAVPLVSRSPAREERKLLAQPKEDGLTSIKVKKSAQVFGTWIEGAPGPSARHLAHNLITSRFCLSKSRDGY